MARKRINQNLVDWADTIFVMNEAEDKHLTFLKENYDLSGKEIHDLNIPDIYKRGNTKLINFLKNRIAKYIPLD